MKNFITLLGRLSRHNLIAALFILVALIMIQPAQAQTASGTATISKKLGFGIKAGLNFAKVSSGSDSVQYSYKPGFMAGVFLSPPRRGIIGYRTELLYSRQGFKYVNPNGTSGNVTNDYLMMPHLMTINITKFVQLQIGAFAGYLLHSKDSNAPPKSDNSTEQQIMDYMNRLDFGAAGGVEIYPFKGIIIGARYNMGFTKLYKEQNNNTSPDNNFTTSFNPLGNLDTKSGVIQVFAGYDF